MEHAGPFWTERVKTVLDGTNSAHLISESATLKATLALPLNLALPIAKLKFRFGPNKVYSKRPPFAVKRGARRQGHPTTVFGEISVRSPLEWLKFSGAQEQLKISKMFRGDCSLGAEF